MGSEIGSDLEGNSIIRPVLGLQHVLPEFLARGTAVIYFPPESWNETGIVPRRFQPL